MPRILVIALVAVVVVVSAIVGRSQMTNDQPKIQIGGPFTLTDHTGKRVTDKDYAGKYMLVYFGYTFCPDVCPTSLSIVGDALGQLDADTLDKVVPIFITVDPERDTIELMASYVPHFHDKMVGLTGTVAQVKSVVKAYKAYFAKTGNEENGNYTVDHSSRTYLMGPDGAYVTSFAHATPAADMAKKLAETF